MVTRPTTPGHVPAVRAPAFGWAQLTERQRSVAIVGLAVEVLVGVVVAAYAFMAAASRASLNSGPGGKYCTSSFI